VSATFVADTWANARFTIGTGRPLAQRRGVLSRLSRFTSAALLLVDSPVAVSPSSSRCCRHLMVLAGCRLARLRMPRSLQPAA
jgi:hypothetical protein